MRHRAPLRNLIFGVSLCLCILLLSNAEAAKETPIPPPPTQFVTDTAGFMSAAAASALNSRLEDYEKSSGHQLLVYIGQTSGDAPIEDWANRAFTTWKVGRKSIDDGLVLFIMAADRKLRFEVGYGLEPVVPDSAAGRIIDNVIVPRLQAGNRDEAVTAGMDAVMTLIGGGGVPAGAAGARQDRGRPERPMTLGQLIGFAIIGLIVLIVLITNPSLAIYLLASILSGGGGRGGRDDWGGGGGGFSGGGGRSGGGGATGSW